ncbi:DNA-methyltransferase [Bacteroides reticulotermitis]|uniref:DNA-methyltransferase n=1 Tax=Bacteroides reticulotermitis TaxID=1133319 RepID=UPI003A8A2CB0
MTTNQIYNSECLQGLRSLPDNSINCCVTSPPYYGLRDYGSDKQIGLEKTPEEYIQKLVAVFHEVKRVLTDDGTLWINIGDSYAGSMKGAAGYPDNAMNYKQGTNRGTLGKATLVKQYTGCKPKDLIGIPWMLAFALRADGWYWRDTIIWAKPSCMPESVKDRTTKSHEYILMFSKSRKYYYDYKAISEPCVQYDDNIRDREHTKLNNCPGRTKMGGLIRNNYSSKNKRSVWTVAVTPMKEAHFATFPEKLIVDCIKAGCSECGVVLDPFMGSGTTAIVSRKLNRNYLGFEVNPDYIEIAEDRIYKELGVFA